jgi:hypothetical protein
MHWWQPKGTVVCDILPFLLFLVDQELASLVYEFSARHGNIKTGIDDKFKGTVVWEFFTIPSFFLGSGISISHLWVLCQAWTAQHRQWWQLKGTVFENIFWKQR